MGRGLRQGLSLLLVPALAAAAPCSPPCRSGYTCVGDRCVSRCNPPCAADELCTEAGECVARGASTDLPPPPPPPPALDDAPPPPPPPVEASPALGPSRAEPGLGRLSRELREAREHPSLGGAITLLSIGTATLVAAVVFWSIGVGLLNLGASAGGGTCGLSGSSGNFERFGFCFLGFAASIPTLIMLPIGGVRLGRSLSGAARVTELEEQIRAAGGTVPEPD